MNLYIFNDASSRAAIFGIGTYLRELTRSLRDYAVCITVVHILSDKTDLKKIEQDGILHIYIPRYKKIEQYQDEKRKKLYYRNIVFLLRRHISKNTEKLLFQMNYNNCQMLAEELKVFFECKLIWVGHYLDWGLKLRGDIKRLRYILSKTQEERDIMESEICIEFETEKTLMNTVDHIISLSSYMKKVLCDEYAVNPNHISVIPNGLTDSEHGFSIEKKLLRFKWKFPDDEKLILFAGRLDVGKGLLYLIRAFRKVLNEISGCRLLIVGEGAYNVYMEESIDICAKITYTGLLSQQELFELYHTVDVGIVPSLYEPFGYVPLEMMIHGLPLITTKTSGLNELTENGISALKVPVHFGVENDEIDINLLAQKIIFLLKNPEEANRLKINARKRYENMFTAEIMANNMNKLFNFLNK
jgi:glycosyltransferase